MLEISQPVLSSAGAHGVAHGPDLLVITQDAFVLALDHGADLGWQRLMQGLGVMLFCQGFVALGLFQDALLVLAGNQRFRVHAEIKLKFHHALRKLLF